MAWNVADKDTDQETNNFKKYQNKTHIVPKKVF
jgi:hypothetical protein